MPEKLKFIRVTDLTTGVITEERYLRYGRLHRDRKEGPALVYRDENTGVVVLESYDIKGKTHRDDGPAVIYRDRETGKVTYERYYQKGKTHRVGGPSGTAWDIATGAVVRMWFDRNDRPHRDPAEGPAFYSRDPVTGVVDKEEYKLDGAWHRVDGPAYIVRDEQTGVVVEEVHWVNGKLHRPADQGPAIIERDRVTGKIVKAEYFENHEPASPPRSSKVSRRRGPKDAAPS